MFFFFKFELKIFSSNEAVKIRGEQFRFREESHFSALSLQIGLKLGSILSFRTFGVLFEIEFLFNCSILIRQDLFPLNWTNNKEIHFSFEVGLIEAGENSVGKVGFELGVDVLFIVNINKANAPTSIVVV